MGVLGKCLKCDEWHTGGPCVKVTYSNSTEPMVVQVPPPPDGWHLHADMRPRMCWNPECGLAVREPLECPHPADRVQWLACEDDIPPDGPCLVWSPICRACGADVPMAAVPVEGDDDIEFRHPVTGEVEYR